MIKNYKEFLLEKSKLDIKFGIKEILNMFDKKIDYYKLFNINKDIINNNSNINDLYNNSDFDNSIENMDLRKDVMQSTLDSETLLYKKYILNFFFLLDKDAVQIEEPKYIFMQYYNKDNDKRSDIMCTEHEGKINNFYSKLTDASIDIKKGDKVYTYTSSNSGNNWELANPDSSNKEFKEELDKNELKKRL